MSATDQYTVYSGRYTRTGLVLMVLEYAKLSYRIEAIDLAAGQHRSPEFLTINPAGFVPALRLANGDVMHETPAIMLHLAEQHPSLGLAPAAGDSERAQFLTRLFFVTNDIQPEIKRFYFPARYAPANDQAPAIHAQAFRMLLDRFGVLEPRLAMQDFYLGNRLSLVDLMIAFWTTSVFPADEVQTSCPALACHAERVQAYDPIFAKHIHEHSVASHQFWQQRLPGDNGRIDVN
jgi:glutathione S-transferase